MSAAPAPDAGDVLEQYARIFQNDPVAYRELRDSAAGMLALSPEGFDRRVLRIVRGDSTVPFDAIRVPTLAEIAKMPAPPRTWYFDGLIPAGCFLIVGRPKVGKSWLLQQLALAAATGEDFLGYQCLEPVGVLLVAAEDDIVRVQERTAQICPGTPPERLQVMVGEQLRALAAEYGKMPIAEFIDGYLAAHPAVKVVILDTEATIRALWSGESGGTGGDIKARDYDETRSFDRIALKHRAFIALVNHASKRKGSQIVDLHELVNRTNVALAGASGSIVLSDAPDKLVGDDEDGHRMLGVRGRDLRDDILLAVKQDTTGMFQSLGAWAKFSATAAERELLEAALDLHQDRVSGGQDEAWIRARDIADAVGKTPGTVQRAISRMMKAGRDRWSGYRIETKASRGLRFISEYAERDAL